MTDVMRGVRILEVAEHTFVPAASALLAEWGAEVIKVEHVERGDAMRGLASSGTVSFGDGAHVLLEHSNRGKKSIGLDLSADQGREVLDRLAAVSDVFLTNKLPGVRAKLGIDLDDMREANPDIIYVCGTGQGPEGPDADKGSYDSLGYWARAGVAMGSMRQGGGMVPPPAPAFGDSIGAMTIAGGIMGALFHRLNTGEATTVDVSLLGVGMWSMGAALALSKQTQIPWGNFPSGAPIRNPLSETYETKDGRLISLTCLQAAKFWPEAATVVGRPDLADDPRFADTASITENAPVAKELLAEEFAARHLAEWREILSGFSGPWAVVQNVLEAADDPQSVANGYTQDYVDTEERPYTLVSPPVHYGGRAPAPKRAPAFNEHGDSILNEVLGLDDEAVLDLKINGVVA
ncbi:MAG: CoA transferase [Acidimicrobiales bacterium]|nr:CoA transferase [Acidimicrobiales bacterium]